MKKDGAFARYTVFVLLFNLFVIVWGGFVSASGSGDGCGASWPLCEEAASLANRATFIELFHRATSGLALLAVVGMVVWAFRKFPKGKRVRRLAVWALVFELGEAAIGAILVIFTLVATNESLLRAIVQPLHLVNTYLLIGALGMTVWYAWDRPPIHILGNPHLMTILISLLIVSAFGTIASLASMIFPSNTFIEGVQQDFAADVHYLIRLRILHPLLAVGSGILLWKFVWGRPTKFIPTWLDDVIIGLFVAQFVLGGLNAVLLAPVPIQLSHLLLSDLLWLGVVWFGAGVLCSPQMHGGKA